MKLHKDIATVVSIMVIVALLSKLLGFPLFTDKAIELAVVGLVGHLAYILIWPYLKR